MPSEPTVYVVDDDQAVLRSIIGMLIAEGIAVEPYELAETFLKSVDASKPGCLVVDLKMPGMSGIELLQRLRQDSAARPAVVISGYAEVSSTVTAMQLGAINVLEKPFRPEAFLHSVRNALELDSMQRKNATRRAAAAARINSLSDEEKQVLRGIVQMQTILEIAQELDCSKRTVDLRLASLMKRLGIRNRVQLLELTREAEWS